MSVLLPTSLLRETMVVEPYEGASAYGPVYGTAATVRCRFEGKRRTVRRADGTDVISSGTAFVRPGDQPALQSKVTVGGRVYEVLDVLPGEGLTRPAFYEVLVS